MPLGSIDAARPVFLIVMGISLMVFTFRLASGAKGWAAKLMITGSVMLGFGYAILMPAYEAGLIERITGSIPKNPSIAIAWHALKLVVMNGGWFVLGLGIAMHAKIFPPLAPRKIANPQSRRHAVVIPAHESAA